MKNRFTEFMKGVVQNVVANIVVIAIVPIAGLAFSISTQNPQIALLAVLIVLGSVGPFSVLRKTFAEP